MGWFYHQKPGIESVYFGSELTIWVPIVLSPDQVAECVTVVTLLPPYVRVAIGPIIILSELSLREVLIQYSVIIVWWNEYLSDHQFPRGRWNSC